MLTGEVAPDDGPGRAAREEAARRRDRSELAGVARFLRAELCRQVADSWAPGVGPNERATRLAAACGIAHAIELLQKRFGPLLAAGIEDTHLLPSAAALMVRALLGPKMASAIGITVDTTTATTS
jgi:hypothetical protein